VDAQCTQRKKFLDPALRASVPIPACSLAASSPSSPMSPITNTRLPPGFFHAALGQHADRGAHRGGVGVVGIVDQGGTMPRGLALQAPGHAAEFFQPRGNDFQRHVERDRGGGRGKRVARVVRTRHLQIGAEVSRWV